TRAGPRRGAALLYHRPDAQRTRRQAGVRAAVWHHEGDIRIEDVPAPEQPGPGEAIVEVAYCGICGTDLHEYQDGPHFIPKDASGRGFVSILGHEFSGTVTEVGEGVSRVNRGDRVAV